MKRSKLLQKTINTLVDVSFRDGKIVENQVIKSIKALKTLPKYEAIRALSGYLRGVKRMQRQHTLYVETVIPPSPVQLKKIKRIVEKRVKITTTKVFINPEILGGFRLRVGDEIWDQSILGKLNQVKEAIASGGSNQPN